MNRVQQSMHSWQGTQPGIAPLANAYVPFQNEDPEYHELPLGFVRGTIYTGLDLPFHDSCNQYPKHQSVKIQLQQYKFAIQELALYLDTHPGDREATEKYQAYKKLAMQKENEFTAKYGPISHNDSDGCGAYRWLESPWPWDYVR